MTKFEYWDKAVKQYEAQAYSLEREATKTRFPEVIHELLQGAKSARARAVEARKEATKYLVSDKEGPYR